MKKLNSLLNLTTTSLCATGLFLFANAASAGTATAYTVSVPEPSVMSLMAGGLATAIILARAKRKK